MRKRIHHVRVASSSPHESGVNLTWPELNRVVEEAEKEAAQEKTAMGRYARYMALGELCYRSGTFFRAIRCWENALQACYDADYATLSKDYRETAYYVAECIDTVRRRHGVYRYKTSARRDVDDTYRDIFWLRLGE
ncbi:MAG: hypothetical protein IJ722_03035 [Alloprevotella sp.]|nr:hypothetical protein [Alloprevotella sp.]